MRKFLRWFSIVAIVLSVLAGTVRSQEIQIGTGTVTSFYPFNDNPDAACFYLYTAAEIIGAGGNPGLIRGFSINVISPSYASYAGFSIYMQNTTLTSISGPVASGWQLVYTTPSYTVTSAGWNKFNFQADNYFNYTGGNLLVKICYNNSNYGAITQVYGTNISGRAHVRYGDGDGCSITFSGTSAGTVPRPNARIEILSNPQMTAIYPPASTVLTAGSIIPFEHNNHPSVNIKRASIQPTVYVSYAVVGPSTSPNPDTIYVATAEGDLSVTRIPLTIVGDPNPIRYRFTHAKGIAAHVDPLEGPTGRLDLSNPGISSGEYTIYSRFEVEGRPDLTQDFQQKFYIALPWDLVAVGIPFPLKKEFTKYPLSGTTIPLGITVQNSGINPVDSFRVECRIFKDNVLVYEPPHVVWVNKIAPLQPGTNTTVFFQNFAPTEVGEYEARVRVYLLNSQDLNPSNDFFPPTGGEPHIFKVTYGVDAKPDTLFSPTPDENYKMRPQPVVVRVQNNGFEDIFGAVATVTITNSQGQVVFQDQTDIDIIPSTFPPYKIVRFPNEFVPAAAGTYTATIMIDHPEEGNAVDNTYTTSFVVKSGLAGTYKVCSTCSGNNTFTSLTQAFDEIYKKGVTSEVVLELEDDVYDLGNIDLPYPALDLRTKIIGASENSKIIIRPSQQKIANRASVVVNLYSASGIGILFGQNHNQTSAFAPINSVLNEHKNDYAASDGHIVFDGGPQKSLVFKMHTPPSVMFRAPFYFGTGSRNITVKNCIVDGESTTTSYDWNLPNVKFEFIADRSVYTFEENVRATGTYSAGFVLRNTPPFFASTQSNYYQLDTINISNIIIENNEITKFGYGIVSLGLGVLDKIRGPEVTITKYLNNNNKFIKNKIYNVGRAGIFVGYEENTLIAQNRIYNINATTNDAAGIIVGGEDKSGYLGYHNNNIRIDGNEISNIKSSFITYGVKIDQASYTLQEGVNRTQFFPKDKEKFVVVNNMIYDLKVNNADAHIAGIYLATARNMNVPYFDDMILTPATPGFFTREDRIINNTIIIPNDQFTNTGNIAAIAVMQNKDLILGNNAIAILDDDVASSVETKAAVFYYNEKPKAEGINIERNAFWLADGIDYYRYIEVDVERNLLTLGFTGEFKTLNQWRYWTGCDIYSVDYNFLQDHEIVGSNPGNLRVKSNPTPINSKINNRGARYDEVSNDIDGNLRGFANQRYDIGACEFNGRLLNNDIEIHSIIAPGAYQDLRPTSLFNDAEYIMTQAPVEVKAIVRNNGNMLQSAAQIKVEIFREDTLGNFTIPAVAPKIVTAQISPTDDAVVVFGLGDGKDNDDFIPLTYSQVVGYNVSQHFSTMLPNVTPRYRIKVSLAQPDEMTSNNVLEDKIVRFYLKRAKLDLLLSVENSFVDIDAVSDPTPVQMDQIAGRLNADTLITAFQRIGWFQMKGEADHDFDIFDRRGWEERSVNYTMYRSLFFGDAHDEMYSTYVIGDVLKFLNKGKLNDKSNFIIASQDVVRQNGIPQYLDGTYFTEKILRATPKETRPFDTLSVVRGFALARNIDFVAVPTGFLGDPAPVGDVVNMTESGVGVARVGMFYIDPDTIMFDQKIMCIASSSLFTNVIYFGLDWRHFPMADALIRAAMDYVQNNGGTIIPIELFSFDANAVGKRVELNWITASEVNSSRFDIEKAKVNEFGIGAFAKIDEVKAKGNSAVATEYGPVIDRSVSAGKSYAYRLKMIDQNGEFSYSNTRVVTIDGDGAFEVTSISPNPAKDFAYVSFYSPVEGSAVVEIYNIAGSKVFAESFSSISAGENQLRLDLRNLTAGSYTIVVYAGNRSTTTTLKVVK